MSFRFLTITLCLFLFSSASSTNPIKHLIILMMENRSFDHFLGWLQTDRPNSKVNGLSGNEYNCIIPGNTSSGCVTIGRNGYNIGPDDPGHGFDDEVQEAFGFNKAMNDTNSQPIMNGFVWNAYEKNHNISNPMEMFTIDTAPILNTLGLEYAIFDNWFCSVPTATDPNRAYAMSGTSNGMTSNFNGTLWNQQSYFDFLTKHNVSWAGYYYASTWALAYFEDLTKPPNSNFIFPLSQFYSDLYNDSIELPSFIWLQPSLSSSAEYGPANWQHPDASVALGEQLMQTVYESLKDSKYWNSSALMITYDEHGGFYDHVPPPQTGVPSPDDVVSSNGFTFDRLGVRIPSVLISPWINAGTVITDVLNEGDGEWEGTSNIATASKLFGITDHITKRTEWTATYEKIFLDRSEPRGVNDSPVFEPVKGWTMNDVHEQCKKPMNEHISNEVRLLCTQLGTPVEKCPIFSNQGQASEYILAMMPKYLEKIQENIVVVPIKEV